MAGNVIRDPAGDHLLTPQNAALFVVDYQPSQIAGVNSMGRDLLLDNIVSTVKTAKAFGLPIIHSTINVATGLITDIGPAVGPDIGIEGIAFTAQAVDQVPEPTALTLTISGMTALILRRTLSGRAKRHV